jgi:RNA 3'-terminal phosphate cyclase (ATP)
MERMAATSVKALAGYAPRVASEAVPVRALDPGASLCVVAQFRSGPATFSALGERGVPSEEIAGRAVRDFERFFASGAAVERHLADQILLPVGWIVAGGSGPLAFTTSEVTEHLVTHAWVLELFLPLSIRIEGEPGRPGRVTVAPAGG